MNAVCENAKEFLEGLIADMRFDMAVKAEWTDEGCNLDLRGEDAHIARAENGEMLDALEVLLFQVYGRELEREPRSNDHRRSRLRRLARERKPHQDPTPVMRCYS